MKATGEGKYKKPKKKTKEPDNDEMEPVHIPKIVSTRPEKNMQKIAKTAFFIKMAKKKNVRKTGEAFSRSIFDFETFAEGL